MPPTLRTATITVLTANFQSINTLLANRVAGRTKHYKGAVIENEGEVPVYISVMDDSSQTASANDSKTLYPGQQIKFDDMDTSFTFIATTDANSSNIIGFYGLPVFGL